MWHVPRPHAGVVRIASLYAPVLAVHAPRATTGFVRIARVLLAQPPALVPEDAQALAGRPARLDELDVARTRARPCTSRRRRDPLLGQRRAQVLLVEERHLAPGRSRARRPGAGGPSPRLRRTGCPGARARWPATARASCSGSGPRMLGAEGRPLVRGGGSDGHAYCLPRRQPGGPASPDLAALRRRRHHRRALLALERARRTPAGSRAAR